MGRGEKDRWVKRGIRLLSLPSGALTTPAGEQLLSEFERFAAYSVGTDQDEEPYLLARRIFFHYLGAGNLTLTQSNIDRWIEVRV